MSIIVKRKSPFSGQLNSMEINTTEEELKAYYEGSEPIQNVLGHLSDNEREFIMTGITPKEWDAMCAETRDEGM